MATVCCSICGQGYGANELPLRCGRCGRIGTVTAEGTLVPADPPEHRPIVSIGSQAQVETYVSRADAQGVSAQAESGAILAPQVVDAPAPLGAA